MDQGVWRLVLRKYVLPRMNMNYMDCRAMAEVCLLMVLELIMQVFSDLRYGTAKCAIDQAQLIPCMLRLQGGWGLLGSPAIWWYLTAGRDG